jgi:transposase
MDTPDLASKPMTRRTHSAAFKRKLLRLCEPPGASVAAIALEHGVNANLVFKWRRNRQRSGVGAAAAKSAVLLPVCLEQTPAGKSAESGAPMVVSAAPVAARAERAGTIELEVAGARLCLRGAVDETSLCSVLRALRQTA